MKNRFFELIDVAKVKQMIKECPTDEVVIICPHYSINIQSEYKNCGPEQIDWDWNNFEKAIDTEIMVNDYDDLVCDPHGIYGY